MVRQVGGSDGYKKLQTVEGVWVKVKRDECFKAEKNRDFNIAVMQKGDKNENIVYLSQC